MFQWNSDFSFIFTNFICIIPFFISTNIISTSLYTCFIFKRFKIRRKRIAWFISLINLQIPVVFYNFRHCFGCEDPTLFDLFFLLLLACLLMCTFKFGLLLSFVLGCFCFCFLSGLFVFFCKRKCSFHFNGGRDRVKL